MTSGFWTPMPMREPCTHPSGALLGTFIPGATEDDMSLNVICGSCRLVWDEKSIPLEVLARVVTRLDEKVRVLDGIDPKQLGA